MPQELLLRFGKRCVMGWGLVEFLDIGQSLQDACILCASIVSETVMMDFYIRLQIGIN